MSIAVVTPPQATGVDFDLLKRHLYVDDDSNDDLIASYLAAAVEQVEAHTGKPLGVTELRWTFDEWPAPGEPLELPRGPLVAVTSLETTAGAVGAWSTVDAARYYVDVDAKPPRLLAATWPTKPRSYGPAGRVTFTAGWSAPPPAVKQAVQMLVALWFEHRGAAEPMDFKKLPFAVEALLAPHSNWEFRS